MVEDFRGKVDTGVDWADHADRMAAALVPSYIDLVELAWNGSAETLTMLGQFDLLNPRVAETIGDLSKRVTGISETTRRDINDTLGRALTGWAEDGKIPGMREVGKMLRTEAMPMSQRRAEMIARTETGTAFNKGAILSYSEAGVREVEVIDGDYDAECAEVNGQIWTLEEANANPLAHPNCTRAFAPVVDSMTAPPPPPEPEPAPVAGPEALTGTGKRKPKAPAVEEYGVGPSAKEMIDNLLQRSGLSKEQAREYLMSISEKVGPGWKVERRWVGEKDPYRYGLLNEGVRAWERLMHGYEGRTHKVTFAVNENAGGSGRQRSCFDQDKQRVFLGTNATEKTIVHELGHWAEHGNPAIYDATQKFVARRTQGEVARTMNEIKGTDNYSEGEVAVADNFITPYVGKKYYRKGSSEVLSVGLEYMYRDPVYFAQFDPDHFSLVWDIMTGNIAEAGG